MQGQLKDEIRELQKAHINEKRAHTAFKDELSRVKELLLGKDNRVKQLESECNTLRDENQRLENNMNRKEEQLKVHTREIERLKKEVESLKELGSTGGLSGRGKGTSST